MRDGACHVAEHATKGSCLTDADCDTGEVCIGIPVEQTASVGAWDLFDDAGQPLQGASLTKLQAKTGYTTTEDWTVTYDGSEWEVVGSRSGRQEQRPKTGKGFVSTRRAVSFTVKGNAREGDQFRFSTDNGAREIDVGGTPLQLDVTPEHTSIAVVLHDRDLDHSVLRFIDPETDAVTESALPPDAEPHRIDFSADGSTLFTGDVGSNRVWEVPLDGSAPTEHAMPWPVMDVTALDGESSLLFVAPVDDLSVWIYDRVNGTFVDVNTVVPGDQGMKFLSPVLGVEAITTPHLYRELNDWGTRLFGRSVAVSLASGRVVFMEEDSGCLLSDALGPRTAIEGEFGQSDDYFASFDGEPNPPYLEENAHNNRHVLVSACGGVARGEPWTLTFDLPTQSWEVEGAVSGIQATPAREDERYLSDDGSVSFVLRAGGTPSQDGWTIAFEVMEGILSVDGDNDGDQSREVPFDMPGDPVFFHYTVGPRDNGWIEVDDRAFVLVPAAASNTVGRVNPQEGTVEVNWN
jgi:hypothetical protein